MRTDDIVRQRFTKVFRGYDVQEVDLFLDDVIREMDRYEHERNALLRRLEALLKELEHCDSLLSEYRKKERASTMGPEEMRQDAAAPDADPAPEAAAPLQGDAGLKAPPVDKGVNEPPGDGESRDEGKEAPPVPPDKFI